MMDTTNALGRDLPAPVRAWALAKAAYETAQEHSFAEQRETVKRLTAHDPEPVEPPRSGENWKQAFHEYVEASQVWFERTKPIWDPAVQEIIAKYNIGALQKLERAAEANMVDWSEEQIKKHYGSRYAAVKGAFDAYREGRLYGDTHEKFLKICFNTPAN